MKVCVGTGNASKVEGVRKGFMKFFGRDIEVEYAPVDSGVPPQPIGLEEIIKGARARAVSVRKVISGCKFSVGVEAGIFRAGSHYVDVQASIIIDDKGRESIGLSPAFPLPEDFARSLLNKEVEELEILVDNYYGTKNIGEKGGFIKILTQSAVTREDLTELSVVMALVPWINSGIYFQEK